VRTTVVLSLQVQVRFFLQETVKVNKAIAGINIFFMMRILKNYFNVQLLTSVLELVELVYVEVLFWHKVFASDFRIFLIVVVLVVRLPSELVDVHSHTLSFLQDARLMQVMADTNKIAFFMFLGSEINTLISW
jgi:hypothetical protein